MTLKEKRYFIKYFKDKYAYKYKYMQLVLKNNGDIEILGFNDNVNYLDITTLCHKSYNLGDDLKKSLILMFDLLEELEKVKKVDYNEK